MCPAHSTRRSTTCRAVISDELHFSKHAIDVAVYLTKFRPCVWTPTGRFTVAPGVNGHEGEDKPYSLETLYNQVSLMIRDNNVLSLTGDC